MSIKVLKKKKKVSKELIRWSSRIAVLFIVFYGVFILTNQRMKINNRKEQLLSLSSQLKLQTAKNEELRRIFQSADEENEKYFEKEARKLNLSKPNERIFSNISGN